MVVGRKRSRRLDLPPGLHFDARRQTYYYRPTAGDRKSIQFGRVTRAQAVQEWAKLAIPEMAEPGTLAEPVQDYLVRGLPLVKAVATQAEYRRIAAKVIERWGKGRYAKTAEQAMRGAFLSPAIFTAYLDAYRRSEPGGVQANRDVRFVSTVFGWAIARGHTLFNPTAGCLYIPETERRVLVDDEAMRKLLVAANDPLALMMRLGRVTGMRQTDLRLLKRTQIRDSLIHVKQSKTGVEQEWEISGDVAHVLEVATKLPGRSRSIYVFPTRRGTPYTLSGLQTLWRRACERAGVSGIQFRDIRKTAINVAPRADQTDFAGHRDPRTTERHYKVKPKRVSPLADNSPPPLASDGKKRG